MKHRNQDEVLSLGGIIAFYVRAFEGFLSLCFACNKVCLKYISPAPVNVIRGDQEECVRAKVPPALSHAEVEEVLVDRVAREHLPPLLHELDVIRATHMNPDKSQLFAARLVQGGKVSLDDCDRLLGKETLPPLSQLNDVLHYKGWVVLLYHQIWLLVLGGCRKVLVGVNFGPGFADWADTLCALGADAMLPVVNGGSPFNIPRGFFWLCHNKI